MYFESSLHIVFRFVHTEGERVEMGGIVDPDKGALIYRKTTQVETVEPEEGSGFAQKKIKKITSESSWLGQKSKTDKDPLVKSQESQSWQDDEIEANPLYSSSEYVTDFRNPLYSNRLSTTDEAPEHKLQLEGKGRASRGRPGSDDKGQEYVNYLSATPGLDSNTADTLF